jgi:transaldolase
MVVPTLQAVPEKTRARKKGPDAKSNFRSADAAGFEYRSQKGGAVSVGHLSIKIFADGANLESMKALYSDSRIRGFTTNPTLMKAAGVDDYEGFAREVLEAIPDLPVSFEVFADEFDEMEAQARTIAEWGRNVNVKIPVTNSRGEFAGPLIARLSGAGVVCNVTAMFTMSQVEAVTDALVPETPAILSIFAGRIADSGIDPLPLMSEAARHLAEHRPRAELLWASPRELLNIFHAEQAGCGIITVTADVLKKLSLIGKDQDEYSLETVRMFYNDANAANYTIKVKEPVN